MKPRYLQFIDIKPIFYYLRCVLVGLALEPAKVTPESEAGTLAG